MNFEMARTLTLHALAFALLLQSVELWFVTRTPAFKSVWSYANVSRDLEVGLPLPNAVIRALYGTRGFSMIVCAQILLSAIALIVPCAALFIVLTIGHLLICIRFRGTFNGGSDMMTFVTLTGALILTLAPNEHTQRLGLLYIAIQSLFSYAKAGFVKLRERDWRNGIALQAFLSRSLFTDIRRVGVMLRFKPGLARGLTWFILLFEMGALTLPLFRHVVGVYFALAVVFHFAIYHAFGLNRFFWIWLAAWPSIFYLTSLI